MAEGTEERKETMKIFGMIYRLFTYKKQQNELKMELATKIATHLVNNQGKCPISFAKAFLALCDKEKE
jgi:hypothetical protein